MTLTLDHIAISAATLEEGAAWVEMALGVPLAGGGKHPHMGTHNRLLSLGDLYLEVIAIDPAAPKPGHPRWFDLDRFQGAPRLTNWICRTDDLDAALAAAPPGTGTATDLQRGDFRWRFAVPATGRLPFDDCHPALIQWQGDLHPPGPCATTASACRAWKSATPRPPPCAPRSTASCPTPASASTLALPALRATFETPHGPRVLT
jgi:hypothetical protein